jgi:hypothetical protein|tara:strand:- start:405 stop:710 length:306 start_codon:yes stop_codon:yes gene_type:complete
MSNMHDAPAEYSDFQKRGIPGEYYTQELYSGSAAANPVTNYTGSRYGAAGFIVGSGSANIETHGGIVISATELIVGQLYPIAIAKISGGKSARIYVLKKNG